MWPVRRRHPRGQAEASLKGVELVKHHQRRGLAVSGALTVPHIVWLPNYPILRDPRVDGTKRITIGA